MDGFVRNHLKGGHKAKGVGHAVTGINTQGNNLRKSQFREKCIRFAHRGLLLGSSVHFSFLIM